MTQSQRIAYYFSHFEDGYNMETEPSVDTETVKIKRHNKRKWVPLCAYNDIDDAIKEIKNHGA